MATKEETSSDTAVVAAADPSSQTNSAAAATSVPLREEFSDFALILKDGRELRCHRVKLAEASPVSRAMLRQVCEETRSGKMRITEFEPESAETLLDFIYAEMKRLPVQDVYKRKIDEKMLTPDLLSDGPSRRVCRDLEKNIADDNVVDIWAVAETTRNGKLKRKALDYLGKKEKMMMEIPRLNETFQDPQLMASLVNYMSARMTLSAAGKEEAMTVKVVCFAASGELVFTAAISVKPSDTVGILRALTNSALSNCGQGN